MTRKLSNFKMYEASSLFPWVAELAIRFFQKNGRLSRLHDRLIVFSEEGV